MTQGRVLLVEDDRSILASYGRTLIQDGFDVTSAEGSEQALDRLKTATFDVILLDLTLPKINGFEVVESIHRLSPDLPVIVLSAEMNNQLAVEATERGASQSLVKPVDRQLLKRTVVRAVRSRPSRNHFVPAYLARGAEPLAPVTMNATDAKNQMGQVLETVMQGGVVLITKHETPKAAVIPIEEYERFARAREANLDRLSGEFDALLERMQTPQARRGMQAAFDASPEQLAKAAVRFARKRG
jgi:antitoxin Phd